jgi:hypothetical protein
MSIRGSIFVNLRFSEPKIVRTYSFDGFSLRGEGKMSITIPAGKAVRVTIQLFDAFDNPTMFDGPVMWESSDATSFSVIADDTGYTAEIRSLGPLVGGQWTARGDADLGEGTRELVVLDDVLIVAGDAVRGTASYGPIVD